MKRFWIWCSEKAFDLCQMFEHMAIGRKALRAYRKATKDPSEQNTSEAIRLLKELGNGLSGENFASSTINRCIHQMEMFQRSVKTSVKVKS